MRFPILLLPTLVSLHSLTAQEATLIRVETSRDAWISAAVEAEREGNNGGSPKLKLKGIQEFFLIDFDPSPFQGRRVVKAQLHLRAEGPELLGRVTVSTIADEWVEGSGNGYDRSPGVSSFLWAENGRRHWSGDGPDITGVVLGRGGSVWGLGDAGPRDAEGWQVIPIDPAVVQARIDGSGHGFFVIDDVGNEYTRVGNHLDYHHQPNRFFASKDSNRSRAPYFTLWLGASSTTTPGPSSTKPPSSAIRDQPFPLPALPPSDNHSAPPAPPAFRDLFGEPLRTLHFHAARGEAIGFLLDSVAPDSIHLTAPEDVEISLFATPRVGGQIDPLVPLGFEGAPIQGGGTFVELYVKKYAVSGLRTFQLQTGDQPVEIRLTIWDFTLPDQLSFIPQMNCYNLPDEEETPWFRLAHEHRTTLNQLRYGWTGKVDTEAVPVRKKDGSGWDWSAWDARFGSLFEGTAFQGLRREGVPVEAFYLPFNENWPMDHERHFRGGYWIENAYDEAYWEEFRSAARGFASHLAEHGWSDTIFEFYLNNKVYFKRDRGNRWDACSAPWIFDEPVNTQDFWALRRFGSEFWAGVSGITGPALTFRVDISRPEWQRDLLDGIATTEVISGTLRNYHERIFERARRLGNLVYMYGSANPPGTSNAMPAAWCVETWALGGDGVVPWQTIGNDKSWLEPDPLALLYPTPAGPIPSIRLKAFRAGQQLTEYLTLYCALSGKDRATVGASLLGEDGLRGALQKRSESDAGTARYGKETATALDALRLRLGSWLDARKPEAKRRWHDPRPEQSSPEKIVPRRVTTL